MGQDEPAAARLDRRHWVTPPTHVAHVFPYDTRHLGLGAGAWAASQLERWPLAAVARSSLAGRSTVHVIGPREPLPEGMPLKVVVHQSATSGPTWREWGDDRSTCLELALRRLRPADVAVIHLNDYPAARFAQRAARRTRGVLVFHGRGTGNLDNHVACASRLVVLREDAAAELRMKGATIAAPIVMRPTVDTTRFFPPSSGAVREMALGFVGRAEPGKGVLELARVLAHLREQQTQAHVELVGSARPEDAPVLQRAIDAAGVSDALSFPGEKSAVEVADLMRRWRLLLLPSYSEGFSLVVTEALACGLPVAAITGVLPAELEAEPLVATASRERYPQLVAGLLGAQCNADPPAWVRDHRSGGEEWDELLNSLPPFTRCGRVPVDQWGRLKRVRPLRRAVRLFRRGLSGTRGGSPPPPLPR